MDAAISAPNPLVNGASWAMTQRPVFLTDWKMVSRSQGKMVTTSITSHDTPNFSWASWATSTRTCTWVPQPMRVMSLPVKKKFFFCYNSHLNTLHLKTAFIWILDSMGVWYSNGKVKWLGRPSKHLTFWTINKLYFQQHTNKPLRTVGTFSRWSCYGLLVIMWNYNTSNLLLINCIFWFSWYLWIGTHAFPLVYICEK